MHKYPWIKINQKPRLQQFIQMNLEQAFSICNDILQIRVLCSDFELNQLQMLKKELSQLNFTKQQKQKILNRIDGEIQIQLQKIRIQEEQKRYEIWSKQIDELKKEIRNALQNWKPIDMDSKKQSIEVKDKVSFDVKKQTKTLKMDQRNKSQVKEQMTKKESNWLSKLNFKFKRFFGQSVPQQLHPKQSMEEEKDMLPQNIESSTTLMAVYPQGLPQPALSSKPLSTHGEMKSKSCQQMRKN